MGGKRVSLSFMRFFLDTGDVEEIRQAVQWAPIEGVTTNPSLIAKAGRSQKEIIEEICNLVDGPISAEVISTDTQGMIKEAHELRKIHSNVVIKLPLIKEGLAACKSLSLENIKTNVTLCFSANQALLAAKCGASFISPFIGRLDDIGHDGMALIGEIRSIYDQHGLKTSILAASLRHSSHVQQAALAGADCGTIPLKVLEGLLRHPMTDEGLAKFLQDHQKSQG